MTSKKIINKADKVFQILRKEYPDVVTQLDHENPFELLVATILSAQCTDARVNIVTKDLFKKYIIPKDYISVPVEELEKDIFSLGFYRQKSKSIRNMCVELIENHCGEVPADFDKLTKLSGVGRKTASVVAANAFNIPAIAVDTHVKRLSNLIGLTVNKNPEKIEADLKELLPKEEWKDSSHWLIMHGRNICIARRPKCAECKITKYCDYFNSK
ncbi:MAG: endonuclease III [Melioribacteraceae bacterium]|nr:endonuclease III [Melioribacteraceae bacterium]